MKSYRFVLSFLIGLSLFLSISGNAFSADLNVTVTTGNGTLVAGADVYAFTEAGAYTGIILHTEVTEQ